MIIMGRRSDSSIATVLLTHRLGDRAADPLKSNEYWELLDAVPDPGSLLGLTVSDVEAATGCSADQAARYAALLDEDRSLAFKLEELEQGGLRVITTFDDGYPGRIRERLRSAAPPLLHVAGSLSLLACDGVGVVGSRDADPAAREAAAAIARVAAATKLATVSGGARGIDQTAMAAARDAGGTVVGVLAESLVRRLTEPETRRAVLQEEVCLLTPYRPSAGFSVGNAMGRNKLIYALSTLTVVVATAEGEGGTWAGATEALSRGFGRVAAWTGTGAAAGNRTLVARGAEAIGEVGPELLADGRPAPAAVTSEQLGLAI
jgi:predicted Rossmann fold nucleotide-binding protein DprA/Smf involved in DNA uptake